MKQIKKETIVFQCDHCEFTSPFPVSVRQHEKEHLRKNCKHESCCYFIYDNDVQRQCKTCGIIDTIDMNGNEEKIFRMLNHE